MSPSLLGHSVKRTEDPSLLRGSALYTEDLKAEEALHAAFVRSPFAHAMVEGVDVGRVSDRPGVVGVFTSEDLGLRDRTPRFCDAIFAHPLLARGRVRFSGEPVAAVVARSRAEAVDAAEQVFADLAPLPVVLDPEKAGESEAQLLFEESTSNIASQDDFGTESFVFGEDEIVVAACFVNQRVAASPLEPSSILAVSDTETGGLTVWLPSQAPFWARREIAACLDMDEEQVRVVTPWVGGGFGAKVLPYPEQIIVAALARRINQPVRYTETRSENLVSMNHGRAQVQHVELGAKSDGRLTGLRVRLIQDGGAYPDYGCYLPELTFEMLSGMYRIPKIQCRASCVATNTTPTGPYRGAGRPEATALVERAMDMLAEELSMDPAELRVKNLVPKEAFPFKTATGATYDTGDYRRALDEAMRAADYQDLRAQQVRRRQEGYTKQLGVGISCYVEVTGFDPEYASVEVKEGPRVEIVTGVAPHGQGLETSLAQVASSVLGIPIDFIDVIHSDTGVVKKGEGTWGSRSLQKGGSAVYNASQSVLAKAKELVANFMEVSVEDIRQYEDGRIGIAGAPEKTMDWARLVGLARDPKNLPAGVEAALSSTHDYQSSPNTTYPFGTHIVVVEVDIQTGAVELVRIVAVDDCGAILNPMIVEGQIHGGIAQGVAQALSEEVTYDEMGNPMNGNLALYGMPSAADLPAFETSTIETPTPLNPLGAKGVGESGAIAAPPAVQNAVIDAVSHLGVKHIDMPITPQAVWRAVHGHGKPRVRSNTQAGEL